MKYYTVKLYGQPLAGGHKVYTVCDSNGRELGVWHEKRAKMKPFSSLENAQRFADSLNSGIVRSSYDGVTDVLRHDEKPVAATEIVRHIPRTRIVSELSERPADTVEELQAKRRKRQELKSRGLWQLLGYTLHNDGTVTEPVQNDVAALAAVTE